MAFFISRAQAYDSKEHLPSSIYSEDAYDIDAIDERLSVSPPPNWRQYSNSNKNKNFFFLKGGRYIDLLDSDVLKE